MPERPTERKEYRDGGEAETAEIGAAAEDCDADAAT